MCFRDRSNHVEDLPGPLFVHDRKIVVSAGAGPRASGSSG
jgi:hypothetical protein